CMSPPHRCQRYSLNVVVGERLLSLQEILSQRRFYRAVLTSPGAEDIVHAVSPFVCVSITSAGLFASENYVQSSSRVLCVAHETRRVGHGQPCLPSHLRGST